MDNLYGTMKKVFDIGTGWHNTKEIMVVWYMALAMIT